MRQRDDHAAGSSRDERKKVVLNRSRKVSRKRYKKRQFTPLSETHPDIALEWHPEKNGRWTPDDFSHGSEVVAWWRCATFGPQHQWQATIDSRTSPALRSGCPFCSGRRVCDTNSLSALNPDLAKEWHPTLNGDLSPKDVTLGSGRRIWWICEKGADHVWQARVAQRTGAGSACPFCAGKAVSETNCLASVYPQVADEWHPTNNSNLKPTDVTSASSKEVWWICRNNPDHSWKATVKSRTRANTGCPFCSGKKASKTNSVASLFPEIARLWHPTRNGAIKPLEVLPNSLKVFWWRCLANGKHIWQATPFNQTRITKTCPHCAEREKKAREAARLARDENSALRQRRSGKPIEDVLEPHPSNRRGPPLAETHPEIAIEWYHQKNCGWGPEDFSYGSTVDVWWKCSKNSKHIWRQLIRARGVSGAGCPFCASKIAWEGNCLRGRFPDIAKEWHPTKNRGLTPSDVMAMSSKYAWWQCSRNSSHVWRAMISSRTAMDSHCPHCYAERQLNLGDFPKVLALFDLKKNQGVDPYKLTTYTNVWWRCPEGPDHSWFKPFTKRRGTINCPFCTHRLPSATNVLSSLFPSLAKEFHPTRNGLLTPDRIPARSNKLVWWSCNRCGHSWQTIVRNRTCASTGCPECWRRRRSKVAFEREKLRAFRADRVHKRTFTDTSLAHSFPDIANEFHKTRNSLASDQVTANSRKRVWWQCSKEPSHEWQMQIYTRTARGGNCPQCHGKRVSETNSLKNKYPELAEQWHPKLNGNLTPEKISFGSVKKVWWQCPENPDHAWQRTPNARSKGEGCPFCSRRRVTDDSSLAHLFPDVAALWHQTKNAPLTAWDVSGSSHRKVWWQCQKDETHQWEAQVNHTSRSEAHCQFCKTETESLEARYPALSKSWHPTRNRPLMPSEVVPGSHMKVWWRCPANGKHVWLEVIRTMTRRHKKRSQICPHCR